MPPRTVIIDEGLRDQLAKIIVKGGFELGALIGRQLLPECRDLVLYACPFTPDPEAPGPIKSVEEASKGWMAEQLSSIERSLVGGITVCGVYVVSGEPNAKKVLDTLQRAVEAYAKKRDLPLNLLHVSTQSSQYTCRVRAPEAKGELAAVELKYQALVGKLSLYHSLVSLDVALPPRGGDKAGAAAREKAFFSSLLATVKKEVASIEQGIASVGALEPLSSYGGSSSTSQAFRVEFYSEVSPGEAMYTSAMLPTTEYSNGAIRLTGTVALLGMVHEKETQEEAIKALQADLLMSLQERVLVLRDEAMREREEAEDEGVEPYLCQALHQGGQLALPRRTLVVEDRTKLLFSDYMLVDEEERDSLQRLSQTLALPTPTPGTERVLLTVEGPAPAVTASTPVAVAKAVKPSPGLHSSSSQGGEKAPTTTSSSSTRFLPLLMLGGGLLIVIIAILISLSSNS